MFGLDLKNFQFPVPVDPDRPEEGTRVVNGELVVTKLFDIAAHLQSIKESTKQTETRLTHSWKSLPIVQPSALVYVEDRFEPVPQGAVWHIDHFSFENVSLPTAFTARARVRFYRNLGASSNYLLELQVYENWGVFSDYVNLSAPIVLQQGESIVTKLWHENNTASEYDFRVNMAYREFTSGPQIVQH